MHFLINRYPDPLDQLCQRPPCQVPGRVPDSASIPQSRPDCQTPDLSGVYQRCLLILLGSSIATITVHIVHYLLSDVLFINLRIWNFWFGCALECYFMFLNISAEPLQTTCIDNACDFTDIEFIMSLLLNVEKKYQIENYKCCCTRTSIIIHCLQ